MPRRKRNRRSKRKVYKHQQQHQNVENVRNSKRKTVIAETPKSDDDDMFVTLPNALTPIETPTASVFEKTSDRKASKSKNYSLLEETPFNTPNTHRSNSRTNLSRVFDKIVEDAPMESLNNATPKCSRRFRRDGSPFNSTYINNFNQHVSAIDLVKNRVNTCVKMRSNSSMSKLRSPGLDQIPVMVDVATQTVYFNNDIERNFKDSDSDVYLQSCINIFETPKISQIEKLERAYSCSTLQQNLSKADEINMPDKDDIKINSNISNRHNLKHLQGFNEMRFPSACVSPKVIQNDIRNNESDCEISIFSPQLKTVSTPIQKMQKSEKILEDMARSILSAHIERKLQEKGQDKIGGYYNFSPKTPNNKNLNRNFNDKVLSCKINKLDSCISKRRMYNSVSPKKPRDLSGRLCNNNKTNSLVKEKSFRNDSGIVPKTFSPQRATYSRSENFLNMSNSNMYTRFMTNVKKIPSRYSTKWFGVIKDVCTNLGISVKQKLSSFCLPKHDNENSNVEANQVIDEEKICYNCEGYQKQIAKLATEVNVLSKELDENKVVVVNMSEEIGKIKEELLELDAIKSKVKQIEETLDSGVSKTTAPCVDVAPSPPPPPPIPPPLPPPLPATPALPSTARNTKVVNKKADKRNSENSRPVISLNDILNVKLKKTSDKPLLSRRVTQPLISVQMLSQVKLRPASRPQTPCSVKDALSSPSSLSSSPASSLTKLLTTVDPNVRRLKRLRRKSGYSLDDSRKYLLRRERNSVEDS